MQQLPECDYCERTDSIKKIGDSLVCPDHVNELRKEKSVETAPISVNEVLRKAQAVDTSIATRADLFNAETVAIADILKAIDDDASITNKPYAKATVIQERINRQKQVIFELNQQIVDEHSRQRAQQQALNNLANQLRSDEREKLKLQDINYKPRDVRIPVTPKSLKLTKKRIDKKELRAAAAALGIAEFTFQLIITQKNFTVAQATEFFQKQIAEMKAKTQAITDKPAQ